MSLNPLARRLRPLTVPALAIAVIAALPLARSDQTSQPDSWNPLSPVSFQLTDVPQSHQAQGNLLSFNDFHGAIDPPVGSGGLVAGTPAGGVEFLSTWVKRLRAEGQAAGQKVLTVGAGDLVGATPLVSAAFHDEPAVELLSELGLEISSVGNHEFDEGLPELRRLQFGGCHPVDGCADGDGFGGADYTYLSANVVDKRTKLPVLAPVSVRFVEGVPVGFVGMTLEGTRSIINPGAPGISDIEFLDEIETANKWSKLLSLFGVKAQVLLIHEGGLQDATGQPSTCAGFVGPITDIVAGLRKEFGVVVSGHTHRFYSCSLPNADRHASRCHQRGQQRHPGHRHQLHAGQAERPVRLDRGAQRHRRERHPQPRRLLGQGRGRQLPAQPGADRPESPRSSRTSTAPRWRRSPTGSSAGSPPTSPATTTPQAKARWAMSSPTRNYAYTTGAGAQLALMNPGGIRAALSYGFSPGGEPAGDRSPTASASPFSRSTTSSSPRPSPEHSSRPFWSSSSPGRRVRR